MLTKIKPLRVKMGGSIARFWGKLSIQAHIDKSIHLCREPSLPQDINTYTDFGKCELCEGEVYFEDMMFFVVKGLRFKYVHQIFLDLKRSNSINLPATDTRGKMIGAYGKNQYTASGKVSLYSHIVETSKSIFSLKGEYTSSQLKDAALLSLLHDMGKLTDYLRTCSRSFVVSGDHDIDSSMYAAFVITDLSDMGILEIFQDCLTVKNPVHRKFSSTPCDIFKMADQQNRIQTSYDVFKREVGSDS